MSRKMLIDASHPEETRVVVVDGNRVEELDFESAAKRQLRGNVYLARVTRVEPSLQAAFVEYGGNRHGFLAFSEIHPDYYQIPFEDRKALIEAEEEAARREEEKEERAAEAKLQSKGKGGNRRKSQSRKKDAKVEADVDEGKDPLRKASSSWNVASKLALSNPDDEIDPTALAADSFAFAKNLKVTEFDPSQVPDDEFDDEDDVDNDDSEAEPSDSDEDEDEDDALSEQAEEDKRRRKLVSRRRYKIQEVVKRGQILLIQVVKEERGNKGAALTSYLSLAGRYCVLMPNTPRGGGISRKIASGGDRKRLKKILDGLSVPKGMGVIVRTAGAKRSDTDIQRDYEYLAKVWETIRTTTLKSTAPSLIHQEGDLVKRAIRDMFERDISAVMVSGKEAYDQAKTFVEMLMPGQADKVTEYTDSIPLYLRYQVEKQIEASLEPITQLKSGGYLVIHPTEALVSVDVNSGRSTKERNVERTALKTNLEAAEEVARQMRLRDLAGLVVIDFIDMDESRNNRAVEKKMKEALSKDRARVQMGRISQFGLMEISRQRRRRSLLEGSSASCEHCGGVGRKRSVESSVLKAIRAVEEEGVRGRASRIRLNVSPNVALYLFNEKRDMLSKIDKKFDMFTELVSDDKLHRPEFTIERVELKDTDEADPVDAIEKEEKARSKRNAKSKRDNSNRDNSNRKSSRRSKKSDDQTDGDDQGSKQSQNQNQAKAHDEDSDKPRKRRRRGRRGGRGKRQDDNAASDNNDQSVNPSDAAKPDAAAQVSGLEVITPEKSESAESPAKSLEKSPAKSKRRRTTRRAAPGRNGETAKAEDKAPSPHQERASESGNDDAPKRKRTRRKAPAKSSDSTQNTSVEKSSKRSDKSAEDKDSKPAKAASTRKRVSRKVPSTTGEKADGETTKAKSKPRKSTPKAKAKDDTAEAKKPSKPATGRKRVSRAAPAKAADSGEGVKEDPKPKPARKPKARAAAKPDPKPEPEAKAKPVSKPDTKAAESADDDKPKKRGWFGRRRKAPTRD